MKVKNENHWISLEDVMNGVLTKFYEVTHKKRYTSVKPYESVVIVDNLQRTCVNKFGTYKNEYVVSFTIDMQAFGIQQIAVKRVQKLSDKVLGMKSTLVDEYKLRYVAKFTDLVKLTFAHINKRSELTVLEVQNDPVDIMVHVVIK